MSQLLKSNNLEIKIDLPVSGYNFSRFDWTGKIVSVKYKGIEIAGVEQLNVVNKNLFGKGFYNEFGFDKPVGFYEAKNGDYFHKIGIGLLKKDGSEYEFSNNYEIRPAKFNFSVTNNRIITECISQSANGYSYTLIKQIEVLESSFYVKYCLKNNGEKTIVTNEYNHNFLAINNELVGSDYILNFPFDIQPLFFKETVNPEEKVKIGKNKITFNGIPNEQFFFSNLSGNDCVDATWELINTKTKIGIREVASFKTARVNLWGWKHVISPELFFDINLESNNSVEWARTYSIFDLD